MTLQPNAIYSIKSHLLEGTDKSHAQTDRRDAIAIANRSEGNVEYLSLILVTAAFTTLDLLYSVTRE